MARFISMSDAWAKHDRMIREKGGITHSGDAPDYEVSVAKGPDGEPLPKNRLRVKEGYTVGLETRDVNYKGDAAVVMHEESDRKRGHVNQYVQRYGPDGRSLGTYEVRWTRTGDREMTIESSRRVR